MPAEDGPGTPAERDVPERGTKPQGAQGAAGAQSVEGAELNGTPVRAPKPSGTEPRAEERSQDGGAPTAAASPDAEPTAPAAARQAQDGEPAADAAQDGGREAEALAAQDGEPTAEDAVSAIGPDGRARRVTRRFPLFTRDTARPEGGGRAAARDAPAPARQWPILTVTATVGLGLLLTALDVFRVGTLLIGAALLAGGAMRWMLPDVGMLAVRSRFTDLVTYGVLGVTIVLLAMMAQPQPWLVIPFLDDTLHFTIRT